MRAKLRGIAVLLAMLSALLAPAAELQQMRGQTPRAAANLAPLGRLPASQRLSFALGLPLRNTGALSNLLQEIYDPASTNYHHYLTPAAIHGTVWPDGAGLSGGRSPLRRRTAER